MSKADTFASRLTTLREARGLTREALSQASGVDRAFLWHLENDTKKPSFETATKLADALGVGLDDLRPGR